MGPSATTVRQLLSRLPFKTIFRRDAEPLRGAQFPSLFRDSVLLQWIKKHFIPGHTSRSREDKAARQGPSVASDALAWLAQQLPISADSHDRLFLCACGILGLPTESPLSPRFHDAPWVAILDLLSRRFMRQILKPKSPEKGRQGVGILLQCINSPFIRSKVVPDAGYIRHPKSANYWAQCCLLEDGSLDLGRIGQTPMSFLLARDVPTPSLDSKYELEATWKLIRWRNSISLAWPGLRTDDIWPEVFFDIRRYSSEFLELCLFHFRTWTNALQYAGSGQYDYAAMFDSILEQALHRDLTIREVLALARAFAEYLIVSQLDESSETVDETNIIPRPLSYALAVGRSSESIRATHLGITLLVVQATKSLERTEPLRWARWITLMLWVASPKEPSYLVDLLRGIISGKQTQQIWDEIEMSPANIALQGPHVEEIARILWQGDDGVMRSLSGDAFENPQSLASDVFFFLSLTDTHQRYLELLLQWVPHCHAHHTGSQHILVHLYESTERDSQKEFYASFRIPPVGLESVDWTERRLNPILGMLALSDDQDLSSLQFHGSVGLECAGRILEAVKVVKRRPVELVCLLTDITNPLNKGLSDGNVALILELVKRAMEFMDEEPITPLLRPMASGVQSLRQLAMEIQWIWRTDMFEHIMGEASRICSILQAKYATRLISSTTQLRVLSCASSVEVEQPAMGWLRMHESL